MIGRLEEGVPKEWENSGYGYVSPTVRLYGSWRLSGIVAAVS